MSKIIKNGQIIDDGWQRAFGDWRFDQASNPSASGWKVMKGRKPSPTTWRISRSSA